MLFTLHLPPYSLKAMSLMALLIVVLSGCQRSGDPTPPATVLGEGAPTAPAVATAPVFADSGGATMLSPLPTEGDAVLMGRLLDATTGTPIVSAVQVAPVYWTSQESGAREGSFILNTAQAPFTVSDDEGRFRFDALADGDYVVIVGDITMNYMVVKEEDGSNRVVTVSAAAPTDVGDIPVSWQTEAP